MVLVVVKFVFLESRAYTINIIDENTFQRLHIFVNSYHTKQESVQNWVMRMQLTINLILLLRLLEYCFIWWTSDLNGYFNISSLSLTSLACIWVLYIDIQKNFFKQCVVHCNSQRQKWLDSARMDKQTRKNSQGWKDWILPGNSFFRWMSLVLACYV